VPFAALFLIGDPAEHSLSPEMQGRALAWAEIRGAYVPFRVEARDLRARIEALERLGFRGGNVTIPHKERALRFLDGATEEARAIGAVNVIARRRAGFVGDNTDGRGLADALRERAGIGFRGRRVLLLGAGGAARAVLYAVIAGGAREAVVLNRTPARAHALVRAATAWGGATRLAHGALAEAAALARDANRSKSGAGGSPFDLVVNATSVGLRGERALLVPPGLLSRPRVVVDLVYAVRETRLVSAARAGGAVVIDGLDVLVGQGRRSFETWFGIAPPWGVMAREARAAPRR